MAPSNKLIPQIPVLPAGELAHATPVATAPGIDPNGLGVQMKVDANGYQYVNVAAGGAGGGAVTVADGADVTQGANADAANITGTSGTLSGKLRGLVQLLAACISIPSSWLNVSVQNSSLNVAIIPATTGGLTAYHLCSAASTNATNVKGSAGQLFGWYIYNSNAAARKVAFHNTAGTPTAGASVFFSLVLPAGGAANVALDSGIAFSAGIGITTVTGLADSDNTAVALNDLIINLYYK